MAGRSFPVRAGVAAAIAMAAGAIVYVMSERRLTETFDVPPAPMSIPAGAAAIARGAHIVEAFGACARCHGADSGGAIYTDDRFVGIVAGPNLTRGRGGIGATMTDADWVRALRYGVRRDGTSLTVMPSELFANFDDADLGALIAFLKQLPPVDREVPKTRLRWLGRAMLAMGRLQILAAPKTRSARAGAIAASPTVEYGGYLARVGGCAECHGERLSGGWLAGRPDLPVAVNITPNTLGEWMESDFVRVMREGRRPDGRVLAELMPWRDYGRMSDMELRALWLYLQSVPPRLTGN